MVDLAETPVRRADRGVGVLAAAIVLLIAFGSLLAMGLPVLTAVLGIGAGLSLIALLGHVFPAPSFSPIVASMIGLGVGVDYALFIVTRFREALHHGEDPETATVTAMSTAGRTVVIAGTTVIIGMLGLLVLRQSLLNGVAIAAAATVAMVLLGSLDPAPGPARLHRHPAGQALAAPAAAVAGRPPATGPPPGHGSQPARGRTVGRDDPAAAGRAALLSGGLLLLLAAPALGMKLSMPDESSQARGTMGYSSYATMARGFGPGFDAPLIVAAALPSPTASTTRLRRRDRGHPRHRPGHPGPGQP